jgi:(p)ppGpp synthase/HD superfamily hydrolase
MTTENRESFFNRLRPLLAPTELLNVEIAYALSKHAHRWQERKEVDADGHPIRYFEHLRATALILIDELSIHDPEMIIACLMHDSIEDTNDISDRMLEHLFGKNVAKTVKLLTKNKTDAKGQYYDRLLSHADVKTLIIKGCDRLSNLRTLSCCTAAFRIKQVTETKEVINPIIWNKLNESSLSEWNISLSKILNLINVEIENIKLID